MRIHFLIFLLLSSSLILNAQDNRFLPDCVQGQLVTHKHYLLSYAEDHEQAEWVSYELKAKELNKKCSRKDNFRPDPLIAAKSASLADYRGSNYDRGHLAPAADMVHSELAMSESFYLSNMSPQVPGFNRGIWKELEAKVRVWAKERGEIYVVCGPVLAPNLERIGPNEVSIPEYYYKIVYDAEEEEILAFLLPNQASKENLQNYCCAVDQLEKLTSIDFFPQLADQLETQLESSITSEEWFGSQDEKDQVLNADITPKSNLKTCQGITKAGKPCKRKVKKGERFCYQHKH